MSRGGDGVDDVGDHARGRRRRRAPTCVSDAHALRVRLGVAAVSISARRSPVPSTIVHQSSPSARSDARPRRTPTTIGASMPGLRRRGAVAMLRALPLRARRRPGRDLVGRPLRVQGVPPDRPGGLEQLGSPRRDAEPPTRSDHPPQLREGAGHIGDEEDREAAQHRVERAIRKAERAEVTLDELDVLDAVVASPSRGRPRAAAPRGRRRPRSRSVRPRLAAASAAWPVPHPDVEHSFTRRDAAPRDELGTEPREERQRLVVEVVGGRVNAAFHRLTISSYGISSPIEPDGASPIWTTLVRPSVRRQALCTPRAVSRS